MLMMDRRRALQHLTRLTGLTATTCLTVLARPLNAQAAYNLWTNEYTLSHQTLMRAVSQRFPATLRYGQLISVVLTNPRLVFDPQANRVTTEVDAQMSNVLLQGAPIKGMLAISGALKYDPVKKAVLLDNPNVERVSVDGVPAEYGQPLNAIAKIAATQVLDQYPIYTFKPEQLRYAGRDVEPGAITVLPDGIKVEVRQK